LTAVLRASLAETLQKSTEGEDSSSHSNDDNLADLSPDASDDDDNDIDASPSQHRRLLQQGSSSQLNGHTSRHKGNRGEKSKGDAAVGNGGGGEDYSDDEGAAAPHIGNGNENGGGGVTAEPSWEAYLGPAGDPPANILIRYPDGQRDAWRQPATSRLRALVLFVGSKGFAPADYEVVTNFPRRVLSDLDLDQSLREAGLCPQETVFVQLKD
jgi:hypothetical protein